jgi:hypothetical protein
LFRSIPLRSIPSIQTLYFTIFPLKIPHLIKLTCFGSLRTTNYQFNMNVVENRFIKCQLKSNWLKELMLNNIQIRGPINLISQSFGWKSSVKSYLCSCYLLNVLIQLSETPPHNPKMVS